MANAKQIVIESLPLKENSGIPVPNFTGGKVSQEQVHVEGKAEMRTVTRTDFQMERKVIELDDGTLDGVFTFYPGSIVKDIKADDAAEWACPDIVKLGPICIYKKKTLPALEYSDALIPKGWSEPNKFKRHTVEDRFYFYPENLITQKELIDAIFSHSACIKSPFFRYTIEHPPHIQATLDYERLLDTEKSLITREQEIKKAQESARKKFEAEKATVEAKIKKLKDEGVL